MPDLEGVSHPWGMRPVDRERKPRSQQGAPQGGGREGEGKEPPSEEELAHTMRELEIAVEAINERMTQLGKDVHLEIITTPSGPAVHIVDHEMSNSLGREGWEATRRIQPEEAIEWLNRLQQGEGLIVDEDA